MTTTLTSLRNGGRALVVMDEAMTDDHMDRAEALTCSHVVRLPEGAPWLVRMATCVASREDMPAVPEGYDVPGVRAVVARSAGTCRCGLDRVACEDCGDRLCPTGVNQYGYCANCSPSCDCGDCVSTHSCGVRYESSEVLHCPGCGRSIDTDPEDQY